MVRYAKEHGITTNLDLQRWKVSGLLAATGLAGVFEILQSLNWEVEDVIYQDIDHVVYTCAAKGKAEKAHYNFEGQPRTIRFKALNSSARAAVAQAAKEERLKVSSTAERAAAQKASVAKKQQRKHSCNRRALGHNHRSKLQRGPQVKRLKTRPPRRKSCLLRRKSVLLQRAQKPEPVHKEFKNFRALRNNFRCEH